MRNIAEKQNKFKHYVSKSIKILNKAKIFYIKSMEDCASKIGYDGVMGCPAAPVSRLDRSFSANYSRTSHVDRSRAILEAISKRRMGSEVEFDVPQAEVRQSTTEYNGMMRRSYSIGIGKIGRIDEDKPCYFEEATICPRSRSLATKRHVVYY